MSIFQENVIQHKNSELFFQWFPLQQDQKLPYPSPNQYNRHAPLTTCIHIATCVGNCKLLAQYLHSIIF